MTTPDPAFRAEKYHNGFGVTVCGPSESVAAAIMALNRQSYGPARGMLGDLGSRPVPPVNAEFSVALDGPPRLDPDPREDL